MKIHIDLTGKRIGKLVFVKFIEARNSNAYWLVKCDCGGEKIVKACHVKSGLTKSCGCLQKANNIKLGRELGKNIRTMPRSKRGYVIARGSNPEDYEISDEIDRVLGLTTKRKKQVRKAKVYVSCNYCGNDEKSSITRLRHNYYYCDRCEKYFTKTEGNWYCRMMSFVV